MSDALERMASQEAPAGAWLLAQSDAEDGPFVLARWGDGAPTMMVDQLTLDDLEQLNVLTNMARTSDRDTESDMAEAPELTAEELLQAKLWDATRYAQELDRLFGLRSHLRSVIHRKNDRMGLVYVQNEFDDSELYQAVMKRIADVQALLDELV